MDDFGGFLQDDFGFVDVMALHKVYAELKQHRHFVGIFNALSDSFDTALLGRRGYLSYALLQSHICRQRMHEFAVDLDVIGLENIEDLETILIDAIVFKRKFDANLLKRIDSLLGVLDVLGRFLFRDLYAQV